MSTMPKMNREELLNKLAECHNDTDISAVLVEYTQRNYASPVVCHRARGGFVKVYADESIAKKENAHGRNHKRLLEACKEMVDCSATGIDDIGKTLEKACAAIGVAEAEQRERELPVTEEWLRGIGGELTNSSFACFWYTNGGTYLDIEEDGSVGVGAGNFDIKGSAYLELPIIVKTRGQLLDLIAALGMQPKGGGDK